MLESLLITLLGIIFIQVSLASNIKWLPVPDRNMEAGFEPFGNTTSIKKTRDFSILPLPGIGNETNSGYLVSRVVGAEDTKSQGFASFIRSRKDISEKLGIDKKDTAILIDNKCNQKCINISVRCLSSSKDSGYYHINDLDGYVIKISPHIPTPQETKVPRWVCEFKDLQKNQRIVNDVIGGKAPVENINFYEIRNNGVIRLDGKTARIDGRQPLAGWSH